MTKIPQLNTFVILNNMEMYCTPMRLLLLQIPCRMAYVGSCHVGHTRTD
jgi:hypothetical protein